MALLDPQGKERDTEDLWVMEGTFQVLHRTRYLLSLYTWAQSTTYGHVYNEGPPHNPELSSGGQAPIVQASPAR